MSVPPHVYLHRLLDLLHLIPHYDLNILHHSPHIVFSNSTAFLLSETIYHHCLSYIFLLKLLYYQSLFLLLVLTFHWNIFQSSKCLYVVALETAFFAFFFILLCLFLFSSILFLHITLCAFFGGLLCHHSHTTNFI